MKSALLVLLPLLAAAGLEATVLNPLDNGDLVRHADAIVIGRCVKSEGKWEDRNLFTYATIAVDEVLKGEQKPSVTVVLPGGVDLSGPVPIAMDYEGGPVIAPGEEVFLFLQRIEGIPDGYSVVGFSLGKFSIRPYGAAKIVSRDLRGVTFQGNAAGPRTDDEAPTLPKFKAEIERLVASLKDRSQDAPRPSR